MAKEEKEVEKAVYLPTTAALDLERRVDEEEMTPAELAEKYDPGARDFSGDCDTSAFVGVSPEYMNYAGVAGKPFATPDDGSAASKVELELLDRLSGATAVPVEVKSNQTDGSGSSVPLVYATYSGDIVENREVSVKDAEAEAKRLDPNQDTDKKDKQEDDPKATPAAQVNASAKKTASTPPK